MVEEMTCLSAAESAGENLVVCLCWAAVTCFVVGSKASGWTASRPVRCWGRERERILYQSPADEPIHGRKTGLLCCFPLRYRYIGPGFH